MTEKKVVTLLDGPSDFPELNLITGMIIDTEFLTRIAAVRNVENLLNTVNAKKFAKWCLEYFSIYGKAPDSSITEIFQGEISKIIKQDPTMAESMSVVLEGIAERYGDNEEVFDLPFHLDQAEMYLNKRSMELRQEEEAKLMGIGHIKEAWALAAKYPEISLKQDNDEPLFLTDFPTIEIPERKMIVHPFLKEATLLNIYGEKGRGKSLFIHSLVHAITSETEFGPWSIENNVPCAIVDGELDLEDLRDRFHDLTPDFDTKHPIMMISNAHRVLTGKPPINLLDQNMQNWLLAKFLKYNMKVVFFDNLSCLAPGIDENGKKEYDPINQFRLNLKHHGIANNLVHHLGKTEKQRGTSGRDDNVDTIMILKKVPGYSADMGARFNVEFDKARVRPEFLHLVRTIEAHNIKDPVGEPVWVWDTNTIKNDKQYNRNLEFAKIAQFVSDGITDQRVIAAHLGCVQSTISKKFKTMEDRGLLVKENDEYKLTESGENLRDDFSG